MDAMFGGGRRIGGTTVNALLPDLYGDSDLEDSADEQLVTASVWVGDFGSYRIDDGHFGGPDSPGGDAGGGGLDKTRALIAALSPAPLVFYAVISVVANVALAGSILLEGLGGVHHGSSPLWQAAVRDVGVAMVSCLVALWTGKSGLRGVLLHDRLRLAVVTASFGLSSVLCSVGLSRSNSLTAVAWTPAGSLFCVLLAGGLGLERISKTQLSGLFLALAGAFFIILYHAVEQKSGDFVTSGAPHAFLCFGATLMAVWIVFAPQLLHRYGGSVILFWGALVSALLHLALLGIVQAMEAMDSFCGTSSSSSTSSHNCNSWSFPGPIPYYVLAGVGLHMLACSAMLAASRHLPSAHVGAGFTAQPAAFLGLSAIARYLGVEGLPMGGYAELGAVGIGLGLMVVVWDRYRRDRDRRIHHLTSEFVLTKD